MSVTTKKKCPECGRRYSGFHAKAACQLWAATRIGNKYGIERVDYAGRSFGSALEKEVYQLLLLRMKAGEFTSVKCQVYVYMKIPRTNYRVLYIADFECEREGDASLFVEAKGKEFPKWKMVKEMWPAYGPGGSLEIWKRGRHGPHLTETIKPELEMETV